MDQVARNRAAIANLRRAHFPARARQRVGTFHDVLRCHDLIVRDQRPQMKDVLFEPNPIETGDVRNIDQHFAPIQSCVPIR